MSSLIEWCNTNNGFVSAVLAAGTLLLSFIAIVVAIRTARLPFKKKVSLGATTDFAVTDEGKTVPYGVSVRVVNIGNRPLYISYLGLAFKENGKYKKLYLRYHPMENKGIVNPSEVLTFMFPCDELLPFLQDKPSDFRLYTYAVDSENQEHIAKFYNSEELQRIFTE